MSHPELLVLGVLRALVEVSMLFLLGQGLLALLAGSRRHDNTMYKLFVIVAAGVEGHAQNHTTADHRQAYPVHCLRSAVLALDRPGVS